MDFNVVMLDRYFKARFQCCHAVCLKSGLFALDGTHGFEQQG
jgi:hypothetical protein